MSTQRALRLVNLKKKVEDLLDNFQTLLLYQEECDSRIERFGDSSQSVRENIEKWIPQLTTDVLLCADANLNEKKGVCSGDSGGPAIIR